MRLTSRSEPGPEPVPGPSIDDELDADISGLLRYRRLVIRVLLVIFLMLPAVALLTSHRHSSHSAFLIAGTVAFVVLSDRIVLVRMPRPGQYERWQQLLLPLLVALAAALFAVGGMGWLTALAVASAAVGRIMPDGRPFVLGLVGCTVIAVAISAATGLGYSNTLVAGAVAALGNLLAHSAERRNVLMYRLNETRAELARAAVADERLRISRDLHDLLGHSLSLITLKAELAGRVIGTDPVRAAREIAELETVARRSLTEVRQAVTSYRQPSLAAELVSSRRMLASAGIDCQLRVPSAYSLPPAVDALLAWTVREGSTNIVRHSAARHAEIVIELSDTEASARLSDDGAGPRGKGLHAIASAIAGGRAATGGGVGGSVGGDWTTGDGAGAGNGAVDGAANGDAGGERARGPAVSAEAGGDGPGTGATTAEAGGDGPGSGTASAEAGGDGTGTSATTAEAGGDGPGSGAASARAGGDGTGTGAASAGAEDDRAGRGAVSAGAGGAHTGSGLAGLAERAARLGGTLSAGAVEDGGFWLRVSVPLTGAPGDSAADPGHGRERMPS